MKTKVIDLKPTLKENRYRTWLLQTGKDDCNLSKQLFDLRLECEASVLYSSLPELLQEWYYSQKLKDLLDRIG